ncbi:MAG: redoxin domain-containing protein, partial [Pseudomonadota bacterium]
MLQIGDKAPDFTLPRDGGSDVTLSALQGSVVVLYFYPKDDTPGCTKEALGFTAHADAFAAANAVVLGMSKDPVKKHDKFVAKHDLT